MSSAWEERCSACGRGYAVAAPIWRCDCGGLLGLQGPTVADPVDDSGPWSLWRYAPALPELPAWPAVTLGEGMTPLVESGDGRWWKADFLNPTLSFKDRGAAVLIAGAAGVGVEHVVADSSGNAGTAVAAYAARAGMAAEVWVPAAASPKKVAAVEAHGATVRRVAGDRAAAAAAARRRVEETGAFYASHVYQPLFLHGVKTVAFEIWEQLGRRAPDSVVVPVGNGTLVLGVSLGFGALVDAGHIPVQPAIVAVQAERCAPLAGLTPSGPTVAEGIAIADPPRAAEILAAVAASGGRIVTVSEEAILDARADLAKRGMWVEPTAAAAWAASLAGGAAAGSTPQAGSRPAPIAGVPTSDGGTSVVVLCGAGLKG